MKFALMLALLLMGQMGYAQTMKAIKAKAEMLERTDLLIEKLEQIRIELEQLDVVPACEKLDEIDDTFFEHVKGVVEHMNVFDKKVVNAYQEGLVFYNYLKEQVEVCKLGKDCENVDPKKVERQLKAIQKALKKHRKVIEKGDTGFENTFQYGDDVNYKNFNYRYEYKYEFSY